MHRYGHVQKFDSLYFGYSRDQLYGRQQSLLLLLTLLLVAANRRRRRQLLEQRRQRRCCHWHDVHVDDGVADGVVVVADDGDVGVGAVVDVDVVAVRWRRHRR